MENPAILAYAKNVQLSIVSLNHALVVKLPSNLPLSVAQLSLSAIMFALKNYPVAIYAKTFAIMVHANAFKKSSSLADAKENKSRLFVEDRHYA